MVARVIAIARIPPPLPVVQVWWQSGGLALVALALHLPPPDPA